MQDGRDSAYDALQTALARRNPNLHFVNNNAGHCTLQGSHQADELAPRLACRSGILVDSAGSRIHKHT
jgi:hypothetical protein